MIKDGEIHTKQKEIAEILAENFKNKISEIWTNFDDNPEEALKILGELRPKRDDNFRFSKISVDTMYDIISKAKPSRTVGDDGVSMDIIKQIPSMMLKIMMRIFNK